MDFRYKALLQTVFSHLPRGESVNYFFQKYITRGFPVSHEVFLDKLSMAKHHYDMNLRYGDSQEPSYFEFGAGWDLINPIVISLLGAKQLYCVDIRRLVDPALVNDVIDRLKRLRHKIFFDFEISDVPVLNSRDFETILQEKFRIHYSAPEDARRTRLPDSSIDFVSSTSTFEHIPAEDIKRILKECYRILKPGGIMSCIIDYQDHWSFFDKDISIYNYLKFPAHKWSRYNPSLNYQNRLRHRDYLKFIEETDFSILVNNPSSPSETERKQLSSLALDPFFRDNYSLDELALKHSKIVFKK